MTKFKKGDVVTYFDKERSKRYGTVVKVKKNTVTVDDGWTKAKLNEDKIEAYQRWEG